MGPRHHLAEQRCVRLPDLHDGQLRARRLEPGAALAASADAIDAAQAVINSNVEAGLVAPGTMSTGLGAESSYDVFDLSGGYDMSKRMALRYGIDNLFDTPPVCTGGRSTARTPHPSPCGGQTEAGFYDILGRSFYVGMKVTFYIKARLLGARFVQRRASAHRTLEPDRAPKSAHDAGPDDARQWLAASQLLHNQFGRPISSLRRDLRDGIPRSGHG